MSFVPRLPGPGAPAISSNAAAVSREHEKTFTSPGDVRQLKTLQALGFLTARLLT